LVVNVNAAYWRQLPELLLLMLLVVLLRGEQLSLVLVMRENLPYSARMLALEHALVMVVHAHRERFLRVMLRHDVSVHLRRDFPRRRERLNEFFQRRVRGV